MFAAINSKLDQHRSRSSRGRNSRRRDSQPRLAARSGITLTEVLISVFVLGSGLLGLAALVPLGQYHAIQANHQDRAAACARWVFRQMESREYLNFDAATTRGAEINMLDPRAWIDVYGAKLPGPHTSAVMLDPRFISLNVANPVPADSFPYNALAEVPGWDMQRVSLEDALIAPGSVLSPVQANRLCVWQDDVTFASANENNRPELVFDPNTGRAANAGGYSWMAMIRPSEQESSANPNRLRAPSLDTYAEYVVSVIVMHNRAPLIDVNESPRSERAVNTTYQAPGWFTLTNNSPHPIGRIAPNQWVMISGRWTPPNAQPMTFHRWYRVVNVVELPNGNKSIKVAGPDWPPNLLGLTGVCTIVDGVVGVYERHMTLETGFRDPVSR